MGGGLISGHSSLALQGAGGAGPLMQSMNNMGQAMAGSNSTMDPLASASRCGILGVPSSNFDSGLFASSSSYPRPRLSLWLGKDPAGASDASQVAGNDHFLLGSTDRLGSGPSSMASLFGSPDSFEGSKPLTSISVMQTANHHSLLAPGFTDMSGSSLSGLSEMGSFPGWSGKTRASQLHVGGLSSNLQINAAGGFAKGNSLSSLPSMPSLLSPAHASPSAQTSATALLQKAAQMGASASNSSVLKGFGNIGTSTSGSILPQGSLLGLTAGLMSPSNAPSPQHGPFNSMVQHEKMLTCSGYGASTHGRSAASNGNEATVIRNPANAAGCGAAGIRPLISSMSPPPSLTPTKSHHFSRCSDKSFENRNPNSPTLLSARDQLSEARYAAGGQHQAKLNAGWSNSSVPKSEDGVTRDFLGVRGLKTFVATAQDHAASAMANPLSHRDPTVMYPLGMEPMQNFKVCPGPDNLSSLRGQQSTPGRSSWTDRT